MKYPLLVLWGARGSMGILYDVLSEWQEGLSRYEAEHLTEGTGFPGNILKTLPGSPQYFLSSW
jgi:hypothetical protein